MADQLLATSRLFKQLYSLPYPPLFPQHAQPSSNHCPEAATEQGSEENRSGEAGIRPTLAFPLIPL